MNTRKFIMYCDPGHAWLAVSRQLLEQLGILDKITSYSYQKGGMVYLEEDCDYTTFKKAMDDAGETFIVQDHYYDGNHWIRNCQNFSK